MIVVALIVGPVFANVGVPTPSGQAFRAYFIADLFAHMSVVGELVKGATPPINPYFPTESLPYYWTYFSFPAVFSALRPALMLHVGILFADLAAAAIFVGIAYLVVRSLGASAAATTIAWLVVVLATSFEGTYYLFGQWQRGRPLGDARMMNIDAVTRWVFKLPGTDGLQRLMWWTPQHEMAITMGLVVMAGLILARDRRSPWIGLFDGLLLGAAFAFSSFNGILLVGSYALAEVARLVLDRGSALGRWLLGRVIAAAVVLGFVGLTVALGMIQRTPGAFIFGWNRYFLRAPWTFLFLSFGPVALFALVGVWPLARRAPRLLVTMAAVLAVCAGSFLYFDVRGHENAYVVFRTAQLVLLLLAIALAFAFDWWRRWWKPLAVTTTSVLFLTAVVSLPTVAIDWYNARDITNVTMSPGAFPWTVHVSPDEQVAIRWVERNLPAEATIQTDADERARWTWALVPAFVRHRMGTGLGLFEPNPARFNENMRKISALYRTTDADEAARLCKEMGIEYLWVGDVERRSAGPGLAKFDEHSERFERVFRFRSVEIFRVR